MNFSVSKENLLQGLQFVSGVIEKRQNMPILANVLLNFVNNQLSITASDSEIELNRRVDILNVKDNETLKTSITLSGRKLIDICRQSPAGETIQFSGNDADRGKVVVQAGKSRFTLATLSSDDFPLMALTEEKYAISLETNVLHQLLSTTSFAMAEQDIRYYMNGLYLEMGAGFLSAVATDGHRLALCQLPFDAREITKEGASGFILPRKAVLELLRIINTESDIASLTFKCAKNAIKFETEKFSFHSRLIEGNFPNYQRVIPKNLDRKAFVDRDALKQALSRMLILAQEKYPACRLSFQQDRLLFCAHNTQNEEADDEVTMDYTGPEIEIAFNIHYLLEALSVLPEGNIQLCFSDNGGSVCVLSEHLPTMTNVIMPMTL